MHERYDYLTTTASAGEVPVPEGAQLIGRWTGLGGIGWYDDERITLVGWPDSATPTAIEGAERLRATARPSALAPLSAGGVFAHRWFEFDPADWDESLPFPPKHGPPSRPH